MPSFELSKMQAVSAARPVSTGERAEIEKRSAERAPSTGESAGKSGVAVEVAASTNASQPPVDTDRVSQIRDALREGTYPLVPTKIADAMIAARLSLSVDTE